MTKNIPMHVRRRAGFSLVELSIVLVILGLLVGGILTGRSLVRASELRAVSAEFQRYRTATMAFRDKYFALPGDFADATRIWGRYRNTWDCATNSAATVNAATGVCDGNADGQMGEAGGGTLSSEGMQYWRQLAAAGLIEGTYSGLAGPNTGVSSVIGTNVPASKFSNAGWTSRAGSGGTTYKFVLNWGNGLTIGAADPAVNWDTSYAAFTPEEAWNIDTKLDDGSPAAGMVVARPYNTCTQLPGGGASTNTSYNAVYTLSDSTVQCGLLLRNLY